MPSCHGGATLTIPSPPLDPDECLLEFTQPPDDLAHWCVPHHGRRRVLPMMLLLENAAGVGGHVVLLILDVERPDRGLQTLWDPDNCEPSPFQRHLLGSPQTPRLLPTVSEGRTWRAEYYRYVHPTGRTLQTAFEARDPLSGMLCEGGCCLSVVMLVLACMFRFDWYRPADVVPPLMAWADGLTRQAHMDLRLRLYAWTGPTPPRPGGGPCAGPAAAHPGSGRQHRAGDRSRAAMPRGHAPVPELCGRRRGGHRRVVHGVRVSHPGPRPAGAGLPLRMGPVRAPPMAAAGSPQHRSGLPVRRGTPPLSTGRPPRGLAGACAQPLARCEPTPHCARRGPVAMTTDERVGSSSPAPHRARDVSPIYGTRGVPPPEAEALHRDLSDRIGEPDDRADRFQAM